jgi:hypothetical protein
MAGPLKSNEQALQVRREALEKLSPSDAEAMRQVLQANKGKNFVQRITNASDWPVVQNPDGGYSSHRMGSAEVGGRNIAFPTLTYDKGANALRAPADPVREAMQTGEYIEFPSPEEAEKFAAGGYKAGMDTGLMQQMLRPEIVNRMWR